jgi:hypothetical protein
MPDVWATFNELDAAVQERLAGVLETRGADFQQQAMRRTFLSTIPFPENAHVLEVGCGTGGTDAGARSRADRWWGGGSRCGALLA